MEITFDTIINYLSNKKTTFINKINIIKPIDEFNFDIPMFRVGILNRFKNKNISMIQSILYCINQEYLYQSQEDKVKLGDRLIKEIESYININYNDNNIMSKLEASKHIESMKKKSFLNYEEILYIFSFCLKTNFIVLDYITEKSSVISYFLNDNVIDHMRPFIILAKNENDFEPVFNHEKKLLSYDDVINYISNYNTINITDIFKPVKSNSKSDSVFINNNNYTFESLNKKLKADLMQICDSMNIKYIKKDLKKTLIEKILTNH